MEYNELLTGLQKMMDNNGANSSQPIENFINVQTYNDNMGLMNDIGTLIQRQEGNQ